MDLKDLIKYDYKTWIIRLLIKSFSPETQRTMNKIINSGLNFDNIGEAKLQEELSK